MHEPLLPGRFRRRHIEEGLDIDFPLLYGVIDRIATPVRVIFKSDRDAEARGGESEQTAQEAEAQEPRTRWWLADATGKEPLDAALVGSADEVRRQLQNLVEAVKPELKVALLELSLFHPDDPHGREFFSFLLGPIAGLHSYMKLIDRNTKSKEYGPLIPNGYLYESPYFTKTYDGFGVASAELAGDDALVLIRYTAREEAREGFTGLCEQIENTFDDVMREVLPTCGDCSGPRRPIMANFSALVPLLRPAAYYAHEVDIHERIRGGGLFLYGERERGTSPSRVDDPRREDDEHDRPAAFLLKPRHVILRGIMAASYSRVDQSRRESLAAQSANLVNAHEIRKFVAQISEASPRSMLDLIRSYFAFLFPIEPNPISILIRHLPFASCGDDLDSTSSLRKIVAAGYEVAAVLSAALWAIGRTVSEQVFSNDINARLKYYRTALEMNDLQESQLQLNFENSWAFFGAIVCASRNALEHADFNHHIQLLTSPDESRLMIRNRRTDRDFSLGITSGDSKRGAHTFAALEYYVNFYCKTVRPAMTLDLDDPHYYCTTIPLPGVTA